MRALLSVYDKTGIVELARDLVSLGYELIASGGTSGVLTDAGISHSSVEDITGFSEMLDGRVKTLHPNLHAGILADRSKESHMRDIAELGISPIDIVVCNLYPFAETPSIETIDVGGPSMIRGAAKNHDSVAVVVAPSDYAAVVSELRNSGHISAGTKRTLAARAFGQLSLYDKGISEWLYGSWSETLPPTLSISLDKAQSLRYGENPHQKGALYFDQSKSSWLSSIELMSGMELSYLNLFDADAAWRLVYELGQGTPAAVIVKHANPSGVAISPTSIADAYSKAFDCDPMSAFGGIVALNRTVDRELASVILKNPKADVIIAPGYEEGVVDQLSAKRKNTRLIKAGPPEHQQRSVRSLGSAFLVQEPDRFDVKASDWKVVSKEKPSETQIQDLLLAWTVCAKTSSNAIVIVNGQCAIGIGAGQQNRVDSSRIAIEKAGDAVVGSVAASDAFFPFSDGLLVLAEAGVSAVISPGGSINDADVIAAADGANLVLIFTGERHFKH